MKEPQNFIEEIKIAHLHLKIKRVSNIDDLLDDLIQKGNEDEAVKDERIPYWADLWPSAIALSEYLVQHNIVKPGMKVLEIGCGLGLPGIVAGKLGANVIFTDYLSEPLEYAKHNWSVNNDSQAKFVQLDWRKADYFYDADLILASDIAYESRSFIDIVNMLNALGKSDKQVLLSEPSRELAKPFMEMITKSGLKCDRIVIPVLRYTIVTNVNVCAIAKKSSF